MKIRFAEKKDCERIHILLKEIAEIHYNLRPDLFDFTPKYTVKELETLLNNNNIIILVATDYNNMVLGYCISLKKSEKKHNFLYIDDICIDKAYRRQGIAKQLILKTKKIANKCGIASIELRVFCDNNEAVKFYENIGMKKRHITMEYSK